MTAPHLHNLIISFALVLVIGVSSLAAQSNCPPLIQTALDTIKSSCDTLGRNEACYGNGAIAATFAQYDTEAFAQAGDIVSIRNLKALSLSPFDEASEEWGVVLLMVQANLPDALPGQNVQLLFFGDTEIVNDGSANNARLNGTLTATANVRGYPSSDGARITGLENGTSVTLVGRNPDVSWVYAELPNLQYGWVFTELVAIEGDKNNLPEIDPGNPVLPRYGSMQAFAMKSGVGAQACQGLPSGGVVVQTPEGSGAVNLQVNGATLLLGSTAILETRENGLTIALIEGYGVVSNQNGTTTIPAGTFVSVGLDDEGQATGEISAAQPYDADTYGALPLSVVQRDVIVAPPLLPEQILTEVNALQTASQSGLYSVTRYTQVSGAMCLPPLPPSIQNVEMHVTADGSTLTFDSLNSFIIGDDVYASSDGITYTFSNVREGEDRIQGSPVYYFKSTEDDTLRFTSPVTFSTDGVFTVYQTQDGRVINECTSNIRSEAIRIGD